MSGDTRRLTRRAVLRTAGATAAASVGTVGQVTAADCEGPGPGPMECVVTNTEAKAYKECPGENYVWDVEAGTLGHVVEVCCDDSGHRWAKVDFECVNETWTVSPDDLDGGQICYC